MILKLIALVYVSLANQNREIVIDASEDGLQFWADAPLEHEHACSRCDLRSNPLAKSYGWTNRRGQLTCDSIAYRRLSGRTSVSGSSRALACCRLDWMLRASRPQQ